MDKSKMDAYTSEYCMSAGDNALSRKQIDESLVAKEFANEGEFVAAMKDAMSKKQKT